VISAAVHGFRPASAPRKAMMVHVANWWAKANVMAELASGH
jgi:hypothetical protein